MRRSEALQGVRMIRFRSVLVQHIAAYSPEARGRSERMFATLQDRVPKELALAGIATVEAEQQDSAFVPAAGLELAEILCIQEARGVGNDNCVSFENRTLQIPERPLRPPLREGNGEGVALPGWRPGDLLRPALSGALQSRRQPARRSGRGSVPSSREARVPSGGREMVLTVSPGNVRRRHRSSRGQNRNERIHDVLPKPDKLMSYRQMGRSQPVSHPSAAP